MVVYINIYMNIVNSKEQIWDILRYNEPTPILIRELIDDILNDEQSYITDWQDIITDGSLGSIKCKSTHYFHIFVYYDMNCDQTLVTIKFKETSYIDKIKQDYLLSGVDIYTIYTQDMDIEEFKLEFEYLFNEFTRYCQRAEYIENHY